MPAAEQPWFTLNPEQSRRLAAAPSVKVEGFVDTPETRAFFASRGLDFNNLNIGGPRNDPGEAKSVSRPYYSPLAPRGEIRILNIEAGLENEPLRCQLQHQPLQKRQSYNADLPSYDALSYTWNAPIRTRYYTKGPPDAGREFTPEAWLASAMAGHTYTTGDKDAPPASFAPQADQVDEAQLMRSVEIVINGRLCDVTGNLAAALYQLRRPDRDRRLWVDAICIDQDSVDERSQQVSQMDRIYQGADTVHVWLGPAADGSDRAITLAQGLWQWGFVNGLEPMELLQPPKLEDRMNILAVLENLTTLCMRPWFTRRWVVQELLLAREAVVHCGTKTIQWRQLAYAVSFLKSQRLKLTYLRINDLYMKADPAKYRRGYLKTLAAETLTDMSATAIRRLPSPGTHPVFERRADLEQLLGGLHALQCTNPLDTVYALLAVARDAETLGIGPPDYNRSVRDLYVDVVLRIIETKHSLNILCQRWAGNVDSKVELPSWTQSFRPAATRHEGGADNSQEQRRFVGNGRGSRFCAAGKQKPKASVGELIDLEGYGQALKVKGVIVDIIAFVSEGAFQDIPASWADIAQGVLPPQTPEAEAKVRSSQQGLAGVLTATQQQHQPPSSPPEDPFATFADLLTAGSLPPSSSSSQTSTSTSPTPNAPIICRALFAENSPYRSNNNNGRINIFEVRAEAAPPALFSPRSTGTPLDAHDTRTFLSEMAACTLHRAVARTLRGGGHVALVDALVPRAEEGDVVAVLVGCDVPVVLRPKKGQRRRHKGEEKVVFEFVGETYMPGFMDGEAIGPKAEKLVVGGSDGHCCLRDIFLA